MSNNILEEFIIGFKFDNKNLRKEAKEADKILDGVAKTREIKGKRETKSFVKNEEAKQRAIKKTRALQEKRVALQANAIRRSSAYQGMMSRGQLGDYDTRMSKMVQDRNIEGLKDLKAEMVRTNSAMQRLTRTQVGLHTVQGGLTDSTRNMVRAYASVFAAFQGTVAIKRVGQDFQAMHSSMLAASGSSEAAAKDMQFINGMVSEMGLNLKDTTDAYVKFKFAAKGKMTQTEIEELFTSVSMFGTSLKVMPEDMKRAQKALSQINNIVWLRRDT